MTRVAVNQDGATKIAPKEESADLAERAKVLSIPFLKEIPENFNRSVLEYIPQESARKYGMVPIQKEKDALLVAMTDPQDFEALNVLRFLAEKERLQVNVSLVSEKVFNEVVKYYDNTDTALKTAILSLKEEADKKKEEIEIQKRHKIAEDQDLFQDAPIANLLEVIIKHALEVRASDIHIEPTDNNYRVRFRIDGLLHSQLVFPQDVGRAVVSRVKILSNLRIDENRKPQDGRFRFGAEDQVVDLRVSSLPVINGEKVVMRVLDKGSNMGNLENLGLWGRNRKVLEESIHEPFGIILITGPTGSGKSTTLYGFLQILNQEDRNIITLEDPVEYNIEGVNQSQVRPEIGYTFANGLRSILRQDPNVIMVGEIRDSETAELAIHAALTGHLVLSTLHTNNAIGAIPRLVDMGLETFLLSSSLKSVVAQRLVRRICESCKQEVSLTEFQKRRLDQLYHEIPASEVESCGLTSDQIPVIFTGKGCDHCSNSGYKGRMAIYEVINIDHVIATIIADNHGDEHEVEKAAKAQGMITMKQDGLLKVYKGVTTLEEVERVTEGKILFDKT